MPHLESLEDRRLLTTGVLGGYSYTTLAFPGGYDTTAHGINDFGQVVGYYDSISNQIVKLNGFLLSGGIYTTLDFPGAAATQPNGISDNGLVVGDYYDAGDHVHGFLLFKGSYTAPQRPRRDLNDSHWD